MKKPELLTAPGPEHKTAGGALRSRCNGYPSFRGICEKCSLYDQEGVAMNVNGLRKKAGVNTILCANCTQEKQCEQFILQNQIEPLLPPGAVVSEGEAVQGNEGHCEIEPLLLSAEVASL